MKMVCIRSCVWLLVLLLVVPAGGFAQDTASAPPVFRQEELDQMLAPIALYPDSLLVQVLMASTYPLEVVQAARWVNQNPNLKDNDLADAMEQKNWDPSVKSLVNFPSVLAMMNDKLDWTQNLGDAFLGQKDQVMATVQDLRAKARARGTLKTTPQQVVVVEEESIVIEPADPQVVYVPVYNPTVVYGPWWYPAYPPYYYHPPGYAVVSAGFISFGIAVGLGAAWGYAWGRPHWASRNVYVNPAQNITLNKYYQTHVRQNNVYISGHDRSEWRHDPIHRKGVEYRDPGSRQQFGHGGSPGADARKDFRGFDPGGHNPVRKPGDAPGLEQHRNAGIPGSHPSGEQRNDAVHHDRPTTLPNKPSGAVESLNRGGNDAVHHDRSTTLQNKSSRAVENLNRGGNEVKQQSERGRVSRESIPTPQKPVQSFQGGKTGQGAGGGFPRTGGNEMNLQRDRGHVNRENIPAPQKPVQSFQGGRTGQGGGFPHTGGNEMNQQRDRGHVSRENIPASQKPAQSFQGGKTVQSGGGNLPNTGGGGRGAGGGGADPRKHIDNQGAGSGDAAPNTGGGRRHQ
jgi:hypothetical protein